MTKRRRHRAEDVPQTVPETVPRVPGNVALGLYFAWSLLASGARLGVSDWDPILFQHASAVIFLAATFTLAGGAAFHLIVGHATFLPYCYLPWMLFFFLSALETAPGDLPSRQPQRSPSASTPAEPIWCSWRR
jgi:hypothetical protein